MPKVRLLGLLGIIFFASFDTLREISSAEPAAGDALPANLWTRTTGSDWEHFLGPTRDNKSPEKGLLTNWPKAGPRIVWKKPLGEGYGGPTISRGRLFQFDRFGDKARIYALHAETGKELWRFEYSTDYQDLYGYNNGPRCSPIVDGGRIYAFGVEGMLHCLSADSGKLLWKVDTARDFGVIQNFFGVGSNPVIHGDLLICMVGGSPVEDKLIPPGQLDRVSGAGSGIVAFNKFTGQVKYKVTDELASYASLQLAQAGGRDWLFAFCRGGLVALEPGSGKVDFQYPWRAVILESVNASVPVVAGNEVLITECYGIGSSLLKFSPGAHEVVWKDDKNRRAKAMLAHWNTPIYLDGNFYGCSGRHTENAELRCVDWKTGAVKWSEPGLSRTSLLYLDGCFICLGEDGVLRLLKANPNKYEPLAEVYLEEPVFGPPAAPGTTSPAKAGVGRLPGAPLLKYPCWAAPIVSHGLLYVRGEDQLVCLEVIPAK